MTDLSQLEKLAFLHRAAKENEATYRSERVAIEAEIVAITGLKPSGQMTVTAGDFKFTVKPNYSYAIDLSAWDEIALNFPIALHPLKVKREPDEAKIRAIKAAHPDLYAILATALTVKPIKPSVSVDKVAA